MGLFGVLFGRPTSRSVRRRRPARAGPSRPGNDLDRRARAFLAEDDRRRRIALIDLRAELAEQPRGSAYGRRDELVDQLARQYRLPRYLVEEAVARSRVARPPKRHSSGRHDTGETPTRPLDARAVDAVATRHEQQDAELVKRFQRLHGGDEATARRVLEQAGVLHTPSPPRATPRLAVGLQHLHRNPSALQESTTFHGEPGEVRGGKVVLGELESLEYRAPQNSQRRGVWKHETNDYGLPVKLPGPKPLLVADPHTNKIQIDLAGSKMHFDPRLGILG